MFCIHNSSNYNVVTYHH